MHRVYVITHPEASHHVENRVGGWFDSHLTAKGLQRAEQIAVYLRALIPSTESAQLFSSDLRRTRQTAEAVSRALALDVTLDPDLREKSYGAAGGKAQAWLDERFVFPPAVGDRLDHDEGIEGAETKREWISRVYAAIARIDTAQATHRVIVTHAGTASWVIAAWMRIPLEACNYAAFRVSSGSVTILEADDRFHNRSLIVLGETNYSTA